MEPQAIVDLLIRYLQSVVYGSKHPGLSMEASELFYWWDAYSVSCITNNFSPHIINVASFQGRFQHPDFIRQDKDSRRCAKKALMTLCAPNNREQQYQLETSELSAVVSLCF